MNIKTIKKDLKELLTPKRYEHSLRVAEESKNLAKTYQYDEKKAYIAGLIHDIAKNFTEEESKVWIEKYKLPKELLEEKYKNIKHADIGAVVAKEKYHLEDDICKAIKYHTIGNKDMDALAKIVFLADKIARNNLPKELQEVKELAYQNLNKALLCCLENEEIHLKSKGIKIHKDTKELLEKLTQEL